MKKIALHNLGCKVNSYEMECIRQKFERSGYETVDFDDIADVYIINTCTVTNIADRKSRQMIHRARKNNPDAIVVALGCYAQTAEQKLKDDGAADIIIGNNLKNSVVDIIRRYEKEKNVNDTVIDINADVPYEDIRLDTATEHTRAYIKIQDGCNQFCTYCIIPYARGRIRSRSEESIFEEITRLEKQGCREIVLTGIHVSSYGMDFDTKHPDLADLIEKIQDVQGIGRIRLGSLEPGVITEDFVRRLKECTKICPHFHLSLQSGCETTLKRMNRHYTPDEYYEKCSMLRTYFDNPAITTDVIVGFPGESDGEFEETKQFVNRVRFSDMHIFKYSRRDGTKAASMDGQVDDGVKNERSRELIDIAAENADRYRKLFVGKECEVLFEEKINISGTEYWTGYTREYIKTAVVSDKNLQNKVEKTRIIGKSDEEIMLALLQ